MKNTISGIKTLTFSAFIIVSSLSIIACDPGSPSGETGFVVTGAGAPLTQAEFNALPPEQQYQVASKLMGTFFRGMTADEFFDLSNGLTTLEPASTTFLIDTRNNLSKNLTIDEVAELDKAIDGLDEDFSNPDEANARYTFDNSAKLSSNERARQIPLARIKDYPISRDLYVNWMAYFLANTIMYSPAEEMESTDMQDVQRMFRFLFNNINEEATISQMVASNLSSLARWRVARTPQNHALEAFENYLGLFEDGSLTEAEKVLFPVLASLPESIENAGVACRDLFLTRAIDDYLISTTDFPNTKPLLILEDSFVVSCGDVYNVVAGHPLLIPRAVEVIINYFMPGPELSDTRRDVSESIVRAGPTTYEQIITALLFSRAYLIDVQRPRSIEETFFPLLDTLKWDVKSNVGLIDNGVFEKMMTLGNNPKNTYVGDMGWASMSLKIGRIPSVPLDVLSFSNYHRSMREELLLQVLSFRGGVGEGGEGLLFDEEGEVLQFVLKMKLDEFIDYLFLSTLHRKATATEQAGLVDFVVVTRDHTNTINSGGFEIEVIKDKNYEEITADILDYVSRLPELYYFNSLNP